MHPDDHSPVRPRRRQARATAGGLAGILLLICGLALAACSRAPGPAIPAASGGATSSNTGVPATTGSTSAPIGSAAWHADAVAYARCMRQHSVNVPDPAPGQTSWNLKPATAVGSPLWGAAWQACQHLLPAGNRPGGDQPNPQQLEQLRTYAVCMRARGIDMSDPQPNGDLVIHGRLAHVTRAQLENDPGFKAAQAACKDKLPGDWLIGGKKR